MSTAEKRKDSRRDDSPRVFLVRVTEFTPGPLPRLKSLALPFRSRSTARCSNVHRTFSRRSRPPGFKSLLDQTHREREGTSPSLSLWSEWRDLNPRPLGPEPSTLPSALHPEIVAGFPDNICCTQILYTGGAVLSNEILHFLCFYPPDFRADLRWLML